MAFNMEKATKNFMRRFKRKLTEFGNRASTHCGNDGAFVEAVMVEKELIRMVRDEIKKSVEKGGSNGK